MLIGIRREQTRKISFNLVFTLSLAHVKICIDG